MIPRTNQSTQHAGEFKLLEEYLAFIQSSQGLCEATLSIRRRDLSQFLKTFKNHAQISTIKYLTASKIHDYIIKAARTLTRSTRKSLQSSLRSFLRFNFMQGYIPKDLRPAVPVIVTRQLEGLPRGISWADAQRLLKCPDKRTAAGRRNYAILMLIVNYGVRIYQALHLRLKDIDFTQGIIRFPVCKWNKALCLPLKPDVAKALLNYLRHDRGQEPFPEVFLTLTQERRPMSRQYYLGSAFKAYYDKAGIQANVHGAHALRHAFATHLMEQQTPIKTIADLLGHRSIRSTFIYTKVDMPRLRLIAQPWPQI